jgi:hypothetical protein
MSGSGADRHPARLPAWRPRSGWWRGADFRTRSVAEPWLAQHNRDMRPLRLFVLALSTTAGLAAAEPLEQPTVHTTLQVERERGGSCSEVHAGKSSMSPALNMTDICHGWTSATCADKLLVHGIGLTEDQAQVLLTEENRAIDAVHLVDQGIQARWPHHEHLHLVFDAPRCEGGAIVLSFSGSHLLANSSGSASALVGVLRIRSSQDHQVELGTEPRLKGR